MNRYANGLISGFSGLGREIDWILWNPPDPWSIPKGMLLRRFINYPFHARGYQSDVNHVLDHSYGHLLFAINPLKTVVTIHDISPTLYPGHILGISGLMWKLSWRGTLRAARMISVSEFTRQEVIRRFFVSPDRIVTIPEAVDPKFQILSPNILNKYRDPNTYQSPMLLHVGSTHPRKNLKSLIQAVAGLHKGGMKVTLLQVGGVATEQLLDLIESLNLQKYIRFVGPVDDAKLIALYNLADVFVYPSLYEGFGFPPLEAMACGTPVVSSNAASLPEVIGNAGILINPNEPTALQEAIASVLMNPVLANELKTKGIINVRRFSWQSTAKLTLNTYQEVLD
ncbi:MAG: glycosyltransferase family 1 protein [Anaerolineales bacterium]|jgi:glycosyltransferase involved in cell wall biosynthesis